MAVNISKTKYMIFHNKGKAVNMENKDIVYTVKVSLFESMYTRYMALFKVPWCLALETSLKKAKARYMPLIKFPA
jgi:hypothetical protein